MPRTYDWSRNRSMWIRVLEKSTGEGLEAWNRRIRQERFDGPDQLRGWLGERGVQGYAQSLLVMERFGYPDFFRASGDELIDAQYADRPHLRPIFDRIVAAAERMGEVTLQARKTYVSLVSPRRTFARIRAATRTRVDLGLRLEKQRPAGRLRPCRMHQTMKVQVSLEAVRDVNAEVLGWLRRAYRENSPPVGSAFEILDLPLPRGRRHRE
ncbi:MAG TPA: DUF5655 domain-containing protein [Gemmatimonadales bacterium]|nr:DUF5655 domain-containing protein [Gemmatimonadales bacterium]